MDTAMGIMDSYIVIASNTISKYVPSTLFVRYGLNHSETWLRRLIYNTNSQHPDLYGMAA